MILIKILLYPFALLYALVVHLRNKLFDWKIIRSEKFDVPVIAVGNLSYGGTGKTPHIEYLIGQLMDHYNVGVLSRGYGRKSKGYILAKPSHTASDIGDEPMQYVRKFPKVKVAVDESRAHGIKQMKKEYADTDLFLLDDAFQHRYVSPDISILLTDFHHLYVDDYPMPTGTLREFRSGAKRADIIVVTKTPKIFSPLLRRELSKKISPKKNQRIFYSYIEYMEPVPLRVTKRNAIAAQKYRTVIMFSGVANSYPLQEHLRDFCNELIVKDYPDHYKYTGKDLKAIIETYNNILSKDKAIFTTEKDAMRLEQEGFGDILDGYPVYYIPIEVKFHHCDEVRFDKFIQKYVRKDQ